MNDLSQKVDMHRNEASINTSRPPTVALKTVSAC
jgi:hypothetical protein